MCSFAKIFLPPIQRRWLPPISVYFISSLLGIIVSRPSSIPPGILGIRRNFYTPRQTIQLSIVRSFKEMYITLEVIRLFLTLFSLIGRLFSGIAKGYQLRRIGLSIMFSCAPVSIQADWELVLVISVILAFVYILRAVLPTSSIVLDFSFCLNIRLQASGKTSGRLSTFREGD